MIVVMMNINMKVVMMNSNNNKNIKLNKKIFILF